MGQIYNRI